MRDFALFIFVPFFIGLGANAVYAYAANLRDYVKTSARHVLGSYKIYWYNTKHFRSTDDRRLSRATILISRDWLLRIKVAFREDDLGDGNYEGYMYDGIARIVESELHLIMHGQSHAETFYAIFDRDLSRGIGCRCGLFLLTSNDELQKPMAIRCLLTSSEHGEDEVRVRIGAKDFLSVRC